MERSPATRRAWTRPLRLGLASGLALLGWAGAGTIPSNPVIYFQTSGPSRPATIGDWYTTASSASSTRFHRFDIVVTQDQLDAAGGALTLTVNDAEATAGTPAPTDEVTGTGDPTRFTLRDSGGTLPGSGGTLLKQQTFPSGSPNGSTFTYSITAAGSYRLFSEDGAGPISGNFAADLNDDDNAFSVSVGDSSFTPVIGQYQSSFQHDSALGYDVYFYVSPSTVGPLSLRNFDMDGAGSVSYLRPDGTAVAGTVSGNGVWNGGGSLNAGADSVPVGASYGWWRMRITGMTANNQAIYEANDGAGNRLPMSFTDPVVLALGKTVDNAAPRVGDTVTYTVSLKNTGALGATGIDVQELLPSGLSYVSHTVAVPTGSLGTYTPGTGNWHVRNLAAGATATLSIKAKVTAPGTITNTATLSGVDQPFSPSTAAVALTSTYSPPGVSKSFGPSAVNADGTGAPTTTLTISLTNSNSAAITGFSLKDDLAGSMGVAGLSITGVTGDTCKATGSETTANGVFQLTNGTLPTGGCQIVLSVSLPATAATGTKTNTIRGGDVTGSIGGAAVPSPADATANLSVYNLAISKAVDKTQASPGDALVYTVTVKNNGGAATSGQNVSDAAPSGATITSWTCTATSGSSCPASGTSGFSRIVSLAAGGSATFTINAAVNANATGTITNTATTTPSGGSALTASASTTVLPRADLSVVKSQRVGTSASFQTTALSALVGQTVQYQIVVTNAGPAGVTGASFGDSVPGNLTGLSVVGTPGTTGSGTVCTASFGSGASAGVLSGSFTGLVGTASCTVIIQGTASTAGSVTNTATVTAPASVLDPGGNNQSSVQTTITTGTPVIALSKLVRTIGSSLSSTTGTFGNTATGQPGEYLEYCLVYENTGTGNATSLVLRDAVAASGPAELGGYGGSNGLLVASGATLTAGATAAPTGTATASSGSLTASQLNYTVGTLVPGAKGVVCFKAQVP